MNYPTKEQREEYRKYKVYCSVCDCDVEFEGFINHENTKKHLKNIDLLVDKDFINIINQTKKIKKDTNETVECPNINLSRQIMIRTLENLKVNHNCDYCDACNKFISKKNIKKHNNTEKHKIKCENLSYKK